MKIAIDEDSLQWFKRELNLHSGDAVRIFARYGGQSTVHPGFSLGITVEESRQIAVSGTWDGIVFFLRDQDLWYFDDRDLEITYQEGEDTVSFNVGPSKDQLGSYVDA